MSPTGNRKTTSEKEKKNKEERRKKNKRTRRKKKTESSEVVSAPVFLIFLRPLAFSCSGVCHRSALLSSLSFKDGGFLTEAELQQGPGSQKH